MSRWLSKRGIAISVRVVGYGLAYAAISALLLRPAFPPLQSLARSVFTEAVPALFIDLHLPVTVARWAVVFVAGSCIGVAGGVLLGAMPRVHAFLSGDIDFFRSLPATALIIFLLAGFGDSEVSRGFPALYITVFTVLFWVSKHVSSVSSVRLRHLRDLGADFRFIVLHFLPLELRPATLVAVRQAVSLSFLVAISVELIVGPRRNIGVGAILYQWQFGPAYEPIIITLVLIGFIGFWLNLIFKKFQRWLVWWEKTAD
jgi:ABC-type nitrate/sulfonate/bicarbonate transport system permease component